MKVNAISNFKGTSYTNFQTTNNSQSKANVQQNSMSPVVKSPVLVDKNYNSLIVKNRNVAFTGIASTALELAQKIPLEDRLASILQVFQHGDLVVVGKSLKDAQKALKESYKSAGQLFKKIFFVPDNNVEGTLAFIKHHHGENELWNINKDKLLINGKDFLSSKESCYVLEGDTIKSGNFELTLKDTPKANLSMVRPTFSRVINLEKDVNPVIEKQNLKSILSIAKDESKKPKPLMFNDVGGQDKAIDMLKKQILFPLKYPEAYKDTMVSRGAILYGPPGTGKTRLAIALSNEADINFVKINGLEMESKWVGESEENWRNLFQLAKEEQPSILFIDEFDAVAKERSGKDTYGDKVVNQLLTLMSDLEKDGDDVFVITATNKMDGLDKAITRSGRFGIHIPVELPDEKGLRQIFDIHAQNKPVEADVEKLVKTLFSKKASGSDVASVITNAKTNAFERTGIHKKMEDGTFVNEDLKTFKIIQEDFDKAIGDLFDKSHSERRPIGFNK